MPFSDFPLSATSFHVTYRKEKPLGIPGSYGSPGTPEGGVRLELGYGRPSDLQHHHDPPPRSSPPRVGTFYSDRNGTFPSDVDTR